MTAITDYNADTSNYELFCFLYESIINREVTTFSQLKTLTAPILKEKRIAPVLMKSFELIKRLYWGFFANIASSSHKKLWREVVIPDHQFPNAGDLKRTISISNLYVVMMDIHGYTKFCQSTRNNLSMLHNFDKTINNEIKNIAASCHSECRREAGDEIVLVAASASDALTATLGIMDYFAKTNILNNPDVPSQRSGNSNALPIFTISAGIAGGNTTIPLIITEQGDLSGFLLNTAARLQAHANTLSAKEARLMVTKQVQMNFKKENANQATECFIFKKKLLYFFDTGIIEFKGVMLPTCEVIFSEDEKYKQYLSTEMSQLFNAVHSSLWEQQIFSNLMKVIVKSVTVMPAFCIKLKEPVLFTTVITNESFIHMCQRAEKFYAVDEDYSYAVKMLHDFTLILEQIPHYDHLILDYLKGITERYDFILKLYQEFIDREIDLNAPRIFYGNQLKIYYEAKNAVDTLDRLLGMGRISSEIPQKRVLWYSLIHQHKDKMVFTPYSGKK
ncbi:MAG: hypothetical protein LBB43_05220 [Spirochaetaceae bacterium]|jgi:hypothetical protein|nr:hypothetical protein [Spirochaetaceae bacterium]